MTALRPAPMLRLLLLALLLTPAAHAQTGEDALRYGSRLPAVGARMSALAGAATAGIGDWEAAYANPAGLGFAPSSAVTGAFQGGWAQSEATFFGAPTDTRVSGYDLGTLGYLAKLPTRQGSFVLGLGFSRTADFDRDLRFSALRPDPNGDFFQYGDATETGGTNAFTAAAALEVAPGVMVGAALNALSGSYTLSALAAEEVTDPIFEELADCQQGECIAQSNQLDADFRGVSARFGVSAALGSGFRAGLALETPTLLRIDERYELYSDYFINYDDLDNSIGFEGVTAQGDFDYTIQTPWRIAGGVAFEEGGLLLSADAELADWSQALLRPRLDFVDPATGFDENAYIRREYRESLTSRFGAEYDFGVGVVRAGLAFETDPLRDLLERDGFEESRTREHYTTGLGLRAGRAMINVAFVHSRTRDRYVPYTLTDLDGAVIDAPVVGEAFSRNRILVGVTVGL